MRTPVWNRTTPTDKEITQKMVFSNEQLPHMFNKIIEEMNNTYNDTNKITIQNLKEIILRFRLTLDDVDFFIQYLQEHEIIQRKGRIIYILNKPNLNINKNKPGRPSKLSEEEKRWIKDNYIPGEFGVKKIAKTLNEKRNDPISHVAIYKYHIC